MGRYRDMSIQPPGGTTTIGTPEHLTQVQDKGGRMQIVDHFDHGPEPVPYHEVVTIGRDGSLSWDD